MRHVLPFIGRGAVSAASYRYWRIYIQDINGNSQFISIAEIELRATFGGSDITTSSTPVTTSTEFSGFPGSDTVDGDFGTNWISGQNNVTNQWLRYDLTTAQAVVQVAIYPQSGQYDRTPKNFIVQGSADGTTFTDVKSFTTTEGSWSDAWKTFNL